MVWVEYANVLPAERCRNLIASATSHEPRAAPPGGRGGRTAIFSISGASYLRGIWSTPFCAIARSAGSQATAGAASGAVTAPRPPTRTRHTLCETRRGARRALGRPRGVGGPDRSRAGRSAPWGRAWRRPPPASPSTLPPSPARGGQKRRGQAAVRPQRRERDSVSVSVLSLSVLTSLCVPLFAPSMIIFTPCVCALFCCVPRARLFSVLPR